ncbi:hypothetical protein ACLSU7_02160 [Bdellovibrio sp. HCB185ZH]|uniref:hypothetical protein n=1 Tax=Bdellovibrio sp. HCB185ZH TaxID=3394235 RepID=UPI0039A6333C
MSNMNRFVVLLSVTLMLGACAHHRDVRPGANGVHRVSLTVDDTDEGNRDAISQANHFCEERGKAAAFVSEQAKYNGTMDEKDYRTAKNISKAAQVVGGTGATYGTANRNKGVQSFSGILGLGGVATDAALGKAYSINMTFKCM